MGWRKRWRSKSDEACEHEVIETSASIHAIIYHFRKLSSSLSLLLPALSPLSPFHCFMKIRSNFSGPLSHRVMRRQLWTTQLLPAPAFYQHQHQLLTSSSFTTKKSTKSTIKSAPPFYLHWQRQLYYKSIYQKYDWISTICSSGLNLHPAVFLMGLIVDDNENRTAS